MAVVRASWPKSLIKHRRSRFQDAVAQCHSCTQELEKALHTKSPFENGIFVGNLGGLAKFCGLQACVLLHDMPSSDGWNQLSHALNYGLASLRVIAGMKFLRCTITMSNEACALYCVSEILGTTQVRDWTAELIVDSYRTAKGLVDLSYTPFSLLVVGLASQHLGVELNNLPDAQEHAGFYNPVLNAQSVDQMQSAIEALSVERVKLVLETHSDYPPFEYSPFDLWPVDLMAVAKLRFPEHTFTYGVLESPLCHPPTPLPFASDPLVERILARCRETMTIPDVDWISAE